MNKLRPSLEYPLSTQLDRPQCNKGSEEWRAPQLTVDDDGVLPAGGVVEAHLKEHYDKERRMERGKTKLVFFPSKFCMFSFFPEKKGRSRPPLKKIRPWKALRRKGAWCARTAVHVDIKSKNSLTRIFKKKASR